MFRIDQTGLPTGTIDRSRTDGLLTGAQVTLTYFGSGTFRPRFLWVPPGDTGSIASLAQVTAGVWTFTPSAGFPGTYRIEEIENEGKPNEARRVRLFRVRTAAGLIIPAPNETANHLANLANATVTHVAQSEDNATDYANALLNNYPWTGWWRAWAEMIAIADSSLAMRWRSVMNIDFTNVGNVTFPADGTYTIGGHSFVFVGFTGLQSSSFPWAILSTVGLRARANASGVSYAGADAPRLVWNGTNLRDLAPTRVRLRYGSSGGSTIETLLMAQWEEGQTYCGVGGYTSAGYGFDHYSMYRVSGGTSTPVASNVDIGAPSSAGNGDNLGLTMPGGAHPLRPLVLDIGNGALAAGDSYIPREIRLSSGDGYTVNRYSNTRSSQAKIVICPQFATHNTTAAIVYLGMLVEQYY